MDGMYNVRHLAQNIYKPFKSDKMALAGSQG